MMSTWTGRCAARLVAAAVLALSCFSTPALANVRAAADVGLLEVSDVLTNYSHGKIVMGLGLGWLRGRAARLELGAEVTDNIGITAGTTILDVLTLAEFSILPVSARVYWDFDPNELWLRSTAYVSATYYHDNYIPDEGTPSPFVGLAAGVTYTSYAVTARAELSVPEVRYPALALSLGLEVGGSYIFGRHHQDAYY